MSLPKRHSTARDSPKKIAAIQAPQPDQPQDHIKFLKTEPILPDLSDKDKEPVVKKTKKDEKERREKKLSKDKEKDKEKHLNTSKIQFDDGPATQASDRPTVRSRKSIGHTKSLTNIDAVQIDRSKSKPLMSSSGDATSMTPASVTPTLYKKDQRKSVLALNATFTVERSSMKLDRRLHLNAVVDHYTENFARGPEVKHYNLLGMDGEVCNFVLSVQKETRSLCPSLRAFVGEVDEVHFGVFTDKHGMETFAIPKSCIKKDNSFGAFETFLSKKQSSANVLFKVSNNELFAEEFKNIVLKKHIKPVQTLKVGVLYIQDQQTQLVDIFANHPPPQSPFWKFLDSIAEPIQLSGWKHYLGDFGQITNDQRSYYTRWRNIEVMFHVAPWLTREQHRQLLGNDICFIIFYDNPENSFDPGPIDFLGTVPQCFTVVQPSAQEGYRLGFFHRSNLKAYLPKPPPKSYLFDPYYLKEYLFTKLFNGFVMSMKCPPMNRLYSTPRAAALKELGVDIIKDKRFLEKKLDQRRETVVQKLEPLKRNEEVDIAQLIDLKDKFYIKPPEDEPPILESPENDYISFSESPHYIYFGSSTSTSECQFLIGVSTEIEQSGTRFEKIVDLGGTHKAIFIHNASSDTFPLNVNLYKEGKDINVSLHDLFHKNAMKGITISKGFLSSDHPKLVDNIKFLDVNYGLRINILYISVLYCHDKTSDLFNSVPGKDSHFYSWLNSIAVKKKVEDCLFLPPSEKQSPKDEIYHTSFQGIDIILYVAPLLDPVTRCRTFKDSITKIIFYEGEAPFNSDILSKELSYNSQVFSVIKPTPVETNMKYQAVFFNRINNDSPKYSYPPTLPTLLEGRELKEFLFTKLHNGQISAYKYSPLHKGTVTSRTELLVALGKEWLKMEKN